MGHTICSNLNWPICCTIGCLALNDLVGQFVDLFGDAQAIKKADLRHRQNFPSRKVSVESKKRPSVETAVTDRAKVHKPYVAATATASPAGPPTYNNGQAQWGAATYAPQTAYSQPVPQGWQQPPPQQPAPQVQSQQWNQGYAAHQVRKQPNACLNGALIYRGCCLHYLHWL